MSHSSALPEPPLRYTGVAIALHWLLALGIVGLFGFGVYMTDLPFSPTRLKYYNWHKWAGITVLLLSGARLLWRLSHRPPALPTRSVQVMPGWQMRAYHATHHLMYLLFFAVPLLGWAYSSAAGFPVVWFGQIVLPDLVGADKALADIIKPLHKFAALGLIALALLHVVAAVKHQWVDRDGLLQRMLPRR